MRRSNFKHDGPPMPDDGFRSTSRPAAQRCARSPSLPAIRDADLTVRIIGRNADVNLGRGTVEVAPGRKLNVANGVFDVPDTHPKPASARATFRIDGTVPAAAELLSSDGLRDTVGLTLDPASSRGTVTAQVAVNMLLGRTAPKDNATYTISADLTNFAADKMLLGQKVEASRSRRTRPTTATRSKATSRSTARRRPSISASRRASRRRTAHQATIDEAARAPARHRSRHGGDRHHSGQGRGPCRRQRH